MVPHVYIDLLKRDVVLYMPVVGNINDRHGPAVLLPGADGDD